MPIVAHALKWRRFVFNNYLLGIRACVKTFCVAHSMLSLSKTTNKGRFNFVFLILFFRHYCPNRFHLSDGGLV